VGGGVATTQTGHELRPRTERARRGSCLFYLPRIKSVLTSVSGALKAVAHAEGRRRVQLHGRAERDRKVSGDHGLELAEAAALSKGELVLG
jgi:hypothetical protein